MLENTKQHVFNFQNNFRIVYKIVIYVMCIHIARKQPNIVYLIVIDQLHLYSLKRH